MSGTFKPTLLNSTLDLGCCKVTHLPLNTVYEGLHRETGSLGKECGTASCRLFNCFLCVSISLGSLLPQAAHLWKQIQVLDSSTSPAGSLLRNLSFGSIGASSKLLIIPLSFLYSHRPGGRWQLPAIPVCNILLSCFFVFLFFFSPLLLPSDLLQLGNKSL